MTTNHPTKKRHRGKRLWRFVKRLFLFGVIVLLVGVGGAALWVASLEIPSLDAFDKRIVVNSTKIYDRTGEVLLYDVHENVRRTEVSSEEISQHVKDAAVAIEDDQFYTHNGVDKRAIIRAAVSNAQTILGLKNTRRGIQGGSTITQQIMKNTILTNEKRLSRKIKEIVLALKVEQVLEKDEILTIYLNEIPFGGSLYGVEEASLAFFGKSAADLTISESAYLASIPNAPTYYSPYGKNTDKLENRKNDVLERMHRFGYISQEEYDEALATEVEFRSQSEGNAKALHFVQYVREYLEEKYGADTILQDGLRIITTLDYDLQKVAEEAALEHALKNQEQYDAENNAIVAIKVDTGEILTMVGSRNYSDEEIDGNFNVATALRQPGSSFKPFAYATAFEKGYTPETVLFDVRTQFASSCEPDNLTSTGNCYSPRNFDGQEKGPLSIRNALAQSRNIPAVKALYLSGVNETLQTAKAMGITSLTNANQYGLTLVLGGGEVSLLDMTSAYGVFANSGKRLPPTAILRVEDNQGNILEEHNPRSEQVLDRNVAAQISDILGDNNARGPLLGWQSFMYFGDGTDIAAKTGTTNDQRDGWVMGYSSEVAVGVWTGNNDNRPMGKGSAISGPAWRDVMTEAIDLYPPSRFDRPQSDISSQTKPILRGIWEGGERFVIDGISKKLATEFTPEETRQEIILADPQSILHWVDKNNPTGPIPNNPERDNQYEQWQWGVTNWIANNRPDLLGPDVLEKPDEEDDVHTIKTRPDLTIDSPSNEDSFDHDDNIKLTIETESNSDYPLRQVDIYFDGIFVTTKLIGADEATIEHVFTPEDISSIRRDDALIEVTTSDMIYNKASDSITIFID